MMPLERQRSCCLSILVLFVFLFPSVSGTPASPITPPLPLVWNSTVVEPNPLRIHCVGEKAWIGLDPSALDNCGDAVDRLYLTDYGRYMSRNFQFLATNTPPDPRFPHTARTPRRYTIGTCTVAVIMLRDYPLSQPMPGKPPGPYPQFDISTFRKIWESASRILTACALDHRYGGYEIIGRDDGMGIFMWKTGSETDRAVGPGE